VRALPIISVAAGVDARARALSAASAERRIASPRRRRLPAAPAAARRVATFSRRLQPPGPDLAAATDGRAASN
jgi:hypothetical protein